MTLPIFTGPGYLGGESPDGLTTVAGVPISARVDVLWRDPADPDAQDVLVQTTQSAADGTWQITDINPELQYVVRGIKPNFDDVTVVGAVPVRTDVLTFEDHLQPAPAFEGVTGHVLLTSGVPPFSVEVIDPLPFGLEAEMLGRALVITGTSDDEGIWQSTVRVTSGNAVTVDVPVTFVIGLTPPTVTPRYGLDGDWTITLMLSGASAFAETLRIYRSTSQIDINALPAPVAEIAGEAVKWVDKDVTPGVTYYYAVNAVVNDVQICSAVVVREAMWTPMDLSHDPKIWLDERGLEQSNAGPLQQWKNFGSIGAGFVQNASVSMPSLRMSDLNGRKTVRFDGVNDYMALTSTSAADLFRNTGAGWDFCVTNRTHNGLLFDSRTPSGAARYLSLTASDGQQSIATRRLDSDATVAARVPEDAGRWVIRSGFMSWASGHLKIRQDGQEVYSAIHGSAGLTANTAGHGGLVSIGNRAFALVAGEYWGGDLAVMIVGSGTLPSPNEIERLEGWAAHRYGITDQLPTSHPYKLTPP